MVWSFYRAKCRPVQPALRGAAVGFPAAAPDADQTIHFSGSASLRKGVR